MQKTYEEMTSDTGEKPFFLRVNCLDSSDDESSDDESSDNERFVSCGDKLVIVGEPSVDSECGCMGGVHDDKNSPLTSDNKALLFSLLTHPQSKIQSLQLGSTDYDDNRVFKLSEEIFNTETYIDIIVRALTHPNCKVTTLTLLGFDVKMTKIMAKDTTSQKR